MKNLSVYIICLFSFLSLKAQDPNFHIYLCFGQSNMEGQGTIEAQDQNVDNRFQIYQAVNCTNKPEETWRTANPPLSRCGTGIGPADYFGRTMVANLPENIKVGIVHVAVAGCKIELFDKDNYASYANGEEQWMKNIIAEYGGNPYARLVELAQQAQQDGVIKGILLHQGESNAGDQQWPSKVKGVYDNLLSDLNLTANDVPLLSGQVVDAGQGGLTAGHNTIINSLPNTISTAHVISSANCTAVSDNLHFTTAGYRILGERYADKMLSLLVLDTDTPPSITTDLEDVTVTEHNNLEISIGVSGSNLSYQWYRDGVIIPSSDLQTLMISNIQMVDDGSTFNVVVSNEFGIVESGIVTLTVTDFDGIKIYKTLESISIDGVMDEIWTHEAIVAISPSNTIVESVSSATDLSGVAKFLWDNDYVYVYAEILDDAKQNDSDNSYEDDAVELYFDIENEKSTSYDANDVQYSFGWNDGDLVGSIPSTASKDNVSYVIVDTPSGYVFEAKIPWATLQGAPVLNKLIGIDFMINDDDNGTGRDGKLSWNAAEDQAWQDASIFGTAILEGVILITDLKNSISDQIVVYPNPTQNSLSIKGLKDEHSYQLLDSMGQKIITGYTRSSIDVSNVGDGVYTLMLENGLSKQSLKIIISK